MRYKDLVENICIRYFKALKSEAKVSQKEIARYIGVSDCLISKWKNRRRRISSEYYKNIQSLFERQEFDICFEKNQQWILKNFDDIDPHISAREFWKQLFQGQLESRIVSLNAFLETLYLILKQRLEHHYSVEMVSKNKKKKCTAEKVIQIMQGDQSLEVYFKDMDTLIIKKGKQKVLIDRQQLKSLDSIYFFRVVHSYEITEKELIFLNQCAEKVEEYLTAEKDELYRQKQLI